MKQQIPLFDGLNFSLWQPLALDLLRLKRIGHVVEEEPITTAATDEEAATTTGKGRARTTPTTAAEQLKGAREEKADKNRPLAFTLRPQKCDVKIYGFKLRKL